jgi:anti-sigma regulatory factor (Ser/Thr protein kinase)
MGEAEWFSFETTRGDWRNIVHTYGSDNPDHKVPMGLDLQMHACRVTVHSQAELRLLFDKLEAWMKILGYSRKDIFAVLISFSEAAANAVRHGNGGDPRVPFQVRYLVRQDEVWVEVEDEGSGFDWQHPSDAFTGIPVGRPSGRGLFLMRAYMNWVCFNPRGNCVSLGRRRSHE